MPTHCALIIYILYAKLFFGTDKRLSQAGMQEKVGFISGFISNGFTKWIYFSLLIDIIA